MSTERGAWSPETKAFLTTSGRPAYGWQVDCMDDYGWKESKASEFLTTDVH